MKRNLLYYIIIGFCIGYSCSLYAQTGTPCTIELKAKQATICSGTSTKIELLAYNTAGELSSCDVLKWQKKNDIAGSFFTDIPNSKGIKSFDTGEIDATTIYKAVTNQCPCSASISAEITINVSTEPKPIIATTDEVCSDGKPISLDASGINVEWTDGTTVLGNAVKVYLSSDTTFYLKYGSSSQCELAWKIKFVKNAEIITPTVGTEFCLNDTIFLDAKGANVQWYDYAGKALGNKSTFVIKSLGDLIVKTGKIGCIVRYNVRVKPAVQFQLHSTKGSKICATESTTLYVTGADATDPTASLYWYPGGQTGTSIETTPGNDLYKVSVFTNGRCKKEEVIKLDLKPASLATLVYTNIANQNINLQGNEPTIQVCKSDAISFSIVESGTYTWSNGATTQKITLSNLPEGASSFSVTVTDASGSNCPVVKRFKVEKGNQLSFVITPSKTGKICQGGEITLKPDIVDEPNSTYLWSNGVSSFENKITNIQNTEAIQVTITNPQGCNGVAAYQVELLPKPIPAIVLSQADICGDGKNKITLLGKTTNGLSPYAYLWDTGEKVDKKEITPLVNISNAIREDKYNLTVTDANGCNATAFVALMVKPLPNNALVEVKENSGKAANDAILCEGAEATLSVAANGQTIALKWADNTTDNPRLVSVTKDINYNVIITNSFGCSVIGQIALKVSALPEKAIVTTQAECLGGMGVLTCQNAVLYANIEWRKEDKIIGNNATITIAKLSIADLGLYKIKATDANNCSTMTELTLKADNAIADKIKEGSGVVCLNQGLFYELETKDSKATYTWQVEPREAAELNIVNDATVHVVWKKSGTHLLSVTKTDAKNCKATTEKSINVNTTTANESEIRYFKVSNILYSTDSTTRCYQWGYVHPDSGLVELKGERYQGYVASKKFDDKRKYWVKVWNGKKDVDCEASGACATIAFFREAILPEINILDFPVQLYPNPNNGTFTLRATNIVAEHIDLLIYDILGRLVHQEQVPITEGLLLAKIAPEQLTNGVYFADLRIGTYRYKQFKFIVQY